MIEFDVELSRVRASIGALPGWTLRMVFAHDAAHRAPDFETAAREEVMRPLPARSFAEFIAHVQFNSAL